MKYFSMIFLMISLCVSISCTTFTKKPSGVVVVRGVEPGPEYDYLGLIYIGKTVLSSSEKVIDSTIFAGVSEEHCIRLMEDTALRNNATYVSIIEITLEGTRDNERYYGIAKIYKLRAAYGKPGQIILSEKGISVQYVFRLQPGPDYTPIVSASAANGSKSGPHAEIEATAPSEEETIIMLRNIAADLGGQLLVIDTISKVTNSPTPSFSGKGKIYKLKK